MSTRSLSARSRGGAQLRPWLSAAGALLMIATLVPPLFTLARRYLFVESIQFSVLAMVGPALIALAAPPRPLPRPPLPRATMFLAVFAGVTVAWRLPVVLSAVARFPWLVAVEAVTLVAAGGGLWLELLRSPSQSRLPGLQRAVIAALAMWCTWITAFALGFSASPVVHGYAGAVRLGAVADQEIAVGLVWGVAGLCFVPVIYAGMLSWLREAGDSRTGSGLPPAGAGARVRGWDRPPRGRGDSPARQ